MPRASDRIAGQILPEKLLATSGTENGARLYALRVTSAAPSRASEDRRESER